MRANPRLVIVLACLAAAALFALAAPRIRDRTPSGSVISPIPASPVAAQNKPNDLFEDRARAAGIDFRLGESNKSPLTVLELMGTGCAAVDFDGDGHADLFVVGQTGASRDGRCALYKNLANGTFADITTGSGLEEPGMYMGCAVADIDNDGLPDLLVTGYGIIRLFRNLGQFRFQDVTKGSGLELLTATSWATGAAFVDYDRDGRVDVFIGRYVIFNDQTIQLCDYGKLKSACGPLFYDPQFGSLYHNEGGFKFKDVTHECGLESAHGKCLGVGISDVDGDGWPDIYLANDEMPGDLFINQKGKSFKNVGTESGVALAADGTMHGGMGIDFADYNHCGRPDLFVTTFQNEADALYDSLTPGTFQHHSLERGLDAPTRMLVGFGTKFIDVANRGWLDLVIANGHIHDNQDLIDKMTHYRQPMQLFWNEEGQQFRDRSQDAGPGFTTPGVGRGLAIADFDDDGRTDIVITDRAGPVRVLFNHAPKPGNWIRVTLKGTKSNRMGLGARVTVIAGNAKWTSECTTAGSYLSASDPRLHFGLGTNRSVDRVEVLWPSGRTSVAKSPKVPGDITIQEP